ncbi:MAG TPA: hypothetical protein VIJ14_05730 [Rhabdochlamydiaceae bacterium]
MAKFEGPFLDDDGELILGEYRFTDADLDYLQSCDREEAKRTLADIGAAAVLIEGESFSRFERLVISCEPTLFD